MIHEPDGKVSFSRCVGAVIIAVILGVFIRAAAEGEWETVRLLALELMLLAGGLYGINKWKS